MISVTVTGLEEAIAKIERLKEIDKPILEGLEEAMIKAKEIVASAYASQTENSVFSLDITQIPNGYVLTASGEDVGFLEFGAGWGVKPDEFADEVDYDVAVGSYSDVEMGMFFRTGHRYWWYERNFYTGIEPTRGMQKALDFLRDNVKKIVEDKIKQWIGN